MTVQVPDSPGDSLNPQHSTSTISHFHFAPTPTPSSAMVRTAPNHRTSAIVRWLQHTRTYDQEEHLVHPFNIPPPVRTKPVTMYQHQHMREENLVRGLLLTVSGKSDGKVGWRECDAKEGGI